MRLPYLLALVWLGLYKHQGDAQQYSETKVADGLGTKDTELSATEILRKQEIPFAIPKTSPKFRSSARMKINNAKANPAVMNFQQQIREEKKRRETLAAP